MKKITITAYTFDELKGKAKEKARDWWRSRLDADTWSDQITEDAAQVGIKIKGFDIGRGQEIDIEFKDSASATAALILKEHGEGCDTRKLAQDFTDTLEYQRPELDEDAREEMGKELLKALGEEYLKLITMEYHDRMSDEGVDEDLEGSEYLFTKEGSRTVELK